MSSSVTRHTGYNLLGSVAPMLIGVLSVPFYLRLIGNDRYGVLAIVWLFLGYFGLFDPGLTRAALYHIARLVRDEDAVERESVFWTALLLNIGFGIVGGVVLYFAARPLFMSTFKMPESMRAEVMTSLPWLAASIPVSIFTAILGGALQARERFAEYNLLYAGNALLAQLVPLAVAFWWGPNLAWLIPAVIIARMLGTIPSFLVLYRVMPLGAGGHFDRAMFKPLFSYGGWVTISNLINPILGSMDRMLIGSVLSAEAVAFYTVPFNLVSRFSILPGALATSLFPRLSRGELSERSRLAGEAVVTLSAVMTPLTILAIAALPIFMKIWVGQTFADHAVPVGIALLVGVWVNSLAYIPAAHLGSINRPDLPAKFHAYELIPFLAVLWLGLHYFGLLGAAWAWTLRVTIDAILLFLVAGETPGWTRVLPGAALVLISTLFSPKTLFSPGTPIEVVLLIVGTVWSWRVSPSLQGVVFRRWAHFKQRKLA
jgi:O-antigen/teichoic acid export membrane protein